MSARRYLLAAMLCCLTMPQALAAEASPIRFPRGASSTVVSGAVVRAERNLYRFDARSGQTLSLKISSIESNAVFRLYGPEATYKPDEDGIIEFSGPAIAGDRADIMRWTGKLPASGAYVIVVGGTRGNATYELRVAIK